MIRAASIRITLALALLSSWPALAHATAMGVIDRARPDYDPKGVDLGGLRLFPSLDLSVTSDDNVYRNAQNSRQDVYFGIAPNLDLRSDWSNHLVEITASARHYRYVEEKTESRTDWNIGARTRLDILRGTTVSAEMRYTALHEPRYSPDLPGAASAPTAYSIWHTDTQFTHAPGRIGFSAGGAFEQLDYQATPLNGGLIVSNKDRDHSIYRLNGKLFYSFSEDASIFVRGLYYRREFSMALDRNDVARGSHGYSVVGGLDLRLSQLIQGELFVGHRHENFKAPLPSISGVDFGAKLSWYLDTLYTLHLSAERQFNPTTLFGAALSDDRIFTLAVDYELLRNLIVQASGQYTDSQFPGIERKDSMWSGSLRADYLLDRHWRAYLGYQFSSRSSNVLNDDFKTHMISAGLKFSL